MAKKEKPVISSPQVENMLDSWDRIIIKDNDYYKSKKNAVNKMYEIENANPFSQDVIEKIELVQRFTNSMLRLANFTFMPENADALVAEYESLRKQIIAKLK